MSDKFSDEFNEWLKRKERKQDQKLQEEKLEKENTIDDNKKSFVSDKEKTQRKEFNNINNDYVNREYVDKEYVDEQIKKNKPRFNTLKATALVLVGAILGSFIGPELSGLFNKNEPQITSNQSVDSARNISINPESEVNVENAVAKKAIQSVVGINVKVEGRNIFGSTTSQEGIGSGVIVSEDGYILTNAHVIGKSVREINVIFSDNSHEKAKVVWVDETLDLAVIKVEKNGMTPIEFADSDKVEIGDKAIAIGNPLGLNLQSTLTSGYVSGLNRSITMENGLVMNGLIQTDASINAGNSGGALLNSEGKLIGVNTAKAGRTDGIGFSIPSNIARGIVEKIRKDGSYNPVTLGIRGIDLVNYVQYTLDYDTGAKEGVIVGEVVPSSTASNAGLKTKDVIVSIGEDKIESMNKLKQVLLKYDVGDTAKVKVIRNKKEIQLDIRFEGGNANI